MSFWDWFIGEAGAAWIIGILGIVGALYTILKRQRPPRVVIQEVDYQHLLSIHETQKSKLRVSYEDNDAGRIEVKGLVQIELAIYNTGTTDISEPLEVRVHLRRWPSKEDGNDPATEVGFWRFLFEAEGCTAIPYSCGKADETDCVAITLPFLNSYSLHKHFIRAWLISEHELELEVTRQTGPGWSAQCVMLRRFWQTQRTIRRIVSIVSLGLAIPLILLAVFPVFDSPLYGFLLRPSQANLERSIDLLQSLRERVQTGQFSFPRPFTREAFLYSSRTFGTSGIVMFTMGYTALLAFATRWSLARKLAEHYYGVVSRFKFQSKKHNASDKSRIERALRELLN